MMVAQKKDEISISKEWKKTSDGPYDLLEPTDPNGQVVIVIGDSLCSIEEMCLVAADAVQKRYTIKSIAPVAGVYGRTAGFMFIVERK